MKFLSAILVLSLAFASEHALAAKRLGGGMSVGKQSTNVTQRNATPPAQQPGATPQPAPAQQAAAAPAKTPAAAPAAAPRKPWGAMLGGLAAGLGLAWLASALGFGEGFAQFLMFALLAVVVMAVVGMVLRARQQRGGASAATPGGLAYQGAGSGSAGGQPVHQAREYSPQNVGNDASARPWERSSMAFESSRFPEAQGGSMIGAALAGNQNWGVPAGFDVDGFLRASKANFISLQAAWDKADIPALRAMMTDGMLEQIKAQLADREKTSGGAPNTTDVVMLEASLLGIEELEAEYMASVEFSGMIREDLSSGPNPFREVWNITRPKSGPGGWLVAGVQALQ